MEQVDNRRPLQNKVAAAAGKKIIAIECQRRKMQSAILESAEDKMWGPGTHLIIHQWG